MRLRPQYPASFPVLLLAGFTLAALPLLGGMINASYMVERIAAEGHRAIAVTLAVSRSGRQLVAGVSSLQRAAGQYLLLRDTDLERAFRESHRNFQNNLAILNAQPLDAPLRRQVADLATTEAALYASLRGAPDTRFDAYVDQFNRLYADAVALEAAGQRLIDRRVARLDESADAVRQALIWQALAMIPLSLFLTGLFSWLINRPLRQLAGMIRRLGEDDLTEFAPVEGPRDLAALGRHLDWLRRRLIDLEQQQNRFLQQVSHELKTPLAALREGVELLADGVLGELGRDQQEVAGIMRGNLHELQRRIEGLIQFSRISQGGEALELADLDLAALITVATRRHNLSLVRKLIRLVVTLGGCRVRGDRAKMEAVFENLLGNAIRFSPQGGTIEVVAAYNGRNVEITLCDQGPGVATADRERIFHPFVQGEVQPREGLAGSGLGLAIAREYLEQHGGSIALLEPSADGVPGACFRVYLPAGQGEGGA